MTSIIQRNHLLYAELLLALSFSKDDLFLKVLKSKVFFVILGCVWMNRSVQYRNVGECVCNIRKRGGGWEV